MAKLDPALNEWTGALQVNCPCGIVHSVQIKLDSGEPGEKQQPTETPLTRLLAWADEQYATLIAEWKEAEKQGEDQPALGRYLTAAAFHERIEEAVAEENTISPGKD